MFLQITKVKYIQDYKIEVTFNDGRSGIADLSENLNGTIFEPLKDKNLFSTVKIDEELDTIVWSNGADLAPEFVYFKAFQNDENLKTQFEKWGYILTN